MSDDGVPMWVIVIIALLALAVGLIVTLVARSGPAYDDRIEDKYNITVLSVEEDGGNSVVFQKNDTGDICTAQQLPDDVLIVSSCEGELERP